VAARNPGIIYAAGTTFGSVGEEARREGADLSGQSAGGLISTTGRDGGEPTTIGVAIADHIGSQNLVGGILAALLARHRTGVGQQVTTSLVGSQIWAQASEYTAQLLQGHPAGRANRSHPLIPGIYGIFPTSDGWIAVVGIVASLRAKFFEVIGRPDLGPKFPEIFYWEADKAALFPELDAAFATATTAEWCERLRAAGLRHAPVRNHAEVVADPSAWANGFFATVEGPDGPTDVVAAPVAFSSTPAVPPAFAPELGQHTEEVLLEVGYEWEDIARLQESGAI
jgi:crotonobetainyl-CoA:carnitine CoA-transferase CaiB-like acyl-CoA transferase